MNSEQKHNEAEVSKIIYQTVYIETYKQRHRQRARTMLTGQRI